MHPDNLKYKRDFLIHHKGHSQTYMMLKSLVIFCKICKEYHIMTNEELQKQESVG